VDVVDKDGICSRDAQVGPGCSAARSLRADTGVPLSNRMQIFDLDPRARTCSWAASGRGHADADARAEGPQAVLAISTPGGDSRISRFSSAAAHSVFGKDIQEAIEDPRINSLHPFSSFDNHESEPGVLESESRVPLASATRSPRAVTGSECSSLRMTPASSPSASTRRTGTLRGGADVRRERYIFGW